MKRYQRWMATLGLVALTNAAMLPQSEAGRRTIARPASTEKGQSSYQRTPSTQATSAAPAAAGPTSAEAEQAANQRMAVSIATAMRKAKLGNEDFDVFYHNGVVTLKGPVSSERAKQRAEQVAKRVPGVEKVENALFVGRRPASPNTGAAPGAPSAPNGAAPANVVPAQGTQPAGPTKGAIQQTGMLAPGNEPIQAPPGEGNEGLQQVPGVQMIPAGAYQPNNSPTPMPPGYPSTVPPGYVPSSVPAPPGHASGGGYPGGYPFAPAFEQPNLPNYAWPTYASYPNYAQVSYPKQYSASAYPYIGPFHPYPQVPLGWRKVQLEWDDGYWQLNFRPRTEKWWWFMDPRNWE